MIPRTGADSDKASRFMCATRHYSTDFAAEARHTTPAIVRICCCTCVGGRVPVYSSRMVTPCTLSPDTHPPHRRLTVHPHPNPGTVRDTPAFCIARAHNFVTVTHRLREAHRKQAKLPPRLPTSARDYTRVSFAASTQIAILAYMRMLVKSPLVLVLNRSPLPHALRSDR